ncbi:unnamed protein product [Chironomus riparius]|uniref:N-acetyltransferase domain-containing protein n=1 Tax=Chironomus riparius TaxID=315576 RepID=A0A9N9S7A1_9DIPT|nr:unnamed protein product [Chironomus riparius]
MQNFFNPPKTHSIFKAKCNLTGKIVDYKIQDLPEGRYYEAVELFVRDYLQCEPMCVSRKMHDNENTKNEFKKMWMNTIRQGVSIACFNAVGTMVGVNILTVIQKDGIKTFEINDQNVKDMVTVMDYTLNQASIFTKYNTDKYLGSLGLCVSREYRGCGIAKELLKARRQVMENLGLIVTATVFSAKGSQNAAKSVGFEEVFAVR